MWHLRKTATNLFLTAAHLAGTRHNRLLKQLFFASPQHHPVKFLTWMFDVSEDITETSDNFESDSDHDQPNNYFTLTYFDGSFTKHTSKALIGVQHYLGRYTPFKQAPLFVVFHTWKSHLA